MNRFSIVFGIVSALLLSPMAYANNFSPTVERQYRQGSTTISEARLLNNRQSKNRRPGLGAFTRRAQSYQRTVSEQTTGSSATGSERRTTRRIGGGRNGYARYLRSLETSNANRVSRFRPGQVEVNSNRVGDTEARTR